MHPARISRVRSFPAIKMFNEVISLLGSPLDIRRSEQHAREFRAPASPVCSSLRIEPREGPSPRFPVSVHAYAKYYTL